MEKHFNPDFLKAVTPDNFLPPISHWTSWGGVMMLTSLVSAIAISSVFKYQITIKAPAKIRPEGELNLVQASKSGKVSQIKAKINQKILQGDIIAYLDDSRLQQERKQLLDKINSTQQQLEQNKQQIKTKEEQIIVAKEQKEQNIATLLAELSFTNSNSQNYRVNSITELKEAQANFYFTQNELARYQQLVDTGAISQLQLSEKEAAHNIAKARLEKVQAQINPSQDQISIVQEKIAQEKVKGKTQLILLQQEKQLLLQQQLQIISQLQSDRQELHKLDLDLSQMVIRSSTSGTIQKLNLRNRGQVVQEKDAIATIVPSESDLVIKATVAVADIQQVKPNQNVKIKVSSCPYTDYGIVQGKVIAISSDVIDFKTNNSNNLAKNYYHVIVEPQNLVLRNSQQECEIKSGMNGRAEIITQQETILKFVLRKARLLVNL